MIKSDRLPLAHGTENMAPALCDAAAARDERASRGGTELGGRHEGSSPIRSLLYPAAFMNSQVMQIGWTETPQEPSWSPQR